VRVANAERAQKALLGGKMTHITRFGLTLIGLATITLPLVGFDASAQEAATSGESGGATVLQEVIVTAQKREENLQSTPIAVTAVTGDALGAEGARSVADLTLVVPGISVGGTGGRTRFAMRGVAAMNQDTNVDDSVAFHVDNVYSSKPAAADVLFYDVSRVEVLRGPQGTLFGRDATTGSVNVITNRPTDTLEARATVGAGNYAEIHTEAMVNVPLTDNLDFRTAFTTLKHNGYFSDGRNDADASAGRVHLLWKPAGNLSILISGDYTHEGGNGPGFSPFSHLSFDSPVSATDYAQFKLDNRIWSTHAEVNWNLDWATLTYIPAYRSLHFLNSTLAQTDPARYIQTDAEDSQELRLASNSADSPLKWVTGLFWHEDNATWNTFFNFYGAGSPKRLWQNIPDQDSESYAAFGQATYAIVPSVRLTGGVRWSSDEKVLHGQNFLATPTYYGIPPAFPPGSLASVYNGDKTWDSVTWKAGLDVDLGPQSMAYVSAATGFHVGGFYNSGPPNSFEPETNTSYEIGSKNRFLNNRLQVNGAIYYEVYNNYQTLEIEQRPGLTGTPVATSVVFNVGRPIDVSGAELESTFLLTDVDKVDVGMTYTHAFFPSFVLNLSTGRTNLGGLQLPKAPEFTGTFQYEHTWKLPKSFTLSGHFQIHVETSSWLTFQHIPDTQQSSYSKSNLGFTLTAPEDRYEITLYGRNLENRDVAKFAVSDASTIKGIGGVYWSDLDPPRTYGIEISTRL
jgi:iron complex outermembrane receptor protein